jgi:conjugal transfer mating pair stabilization protein TraG
MSLKKFLRVVRRRRNRKLVAIIVIFLAVVAVLTIVEQAMPTKINPSAYVPLLNTIAEGESKGNYNAYFGNAANTTVRFTDMSVSEVLQWQAAYVHGGSPSSAVGRYQIVRPTLAGLVERLHIDQSARFDAALQDRLAIVLLERRGSIDYVDNKLTRAQFAANLAQEWAALPKIAGPKPEESFYAGDGLNQSRISIAAVYSALDQLKS